MELHNTSSPTIPYQQNLDVLIAKLPEDAKNGYDTLRFALKEITTLKHRAAGEKNPQQLKYDTEIIKSTIQHIKDNKDYPIMLLDIETAIRGLAPLDNKSSLADQYPKRNPLTPDGTGQRR